MSVAKPLLSLLLGSLKEKWYPVSNGLNYLRYPDAKKFESWFRTSNVNEP